MTRDDINRFIAGNPCFDSNKNVTPQLIETHISWVVLCDRVVYKIKKPILYSFLDFSTIDKRKFYCERELVLNCRLVPDIYLDVVSIKEKNGRISTAGSGNIIDYAVKMQRIDNATQMDVLLRAGKVTRKDIENLANVISDFHQKSPIVSSKDVTDIRNKFNDLDLEKTFLKENLGSWCNDWIEEAIDQSNTFIKNNESLLNKRLKQGMFRDVHGDLHSRNIFLSPNPVIFDCIEFNDDYREIDILNEIAFLCMDLDAFGRKDLSNYFLECYLQYNPIVFGKEEERLFNYYKSYRANVRAKVNSLRARELTGDRRTKALDECKRYLHLMHSYLKLI